MSSRKGLREPLGQSSPPPLVHHRYILLLFYSFLFTPINESVFPPCPSFSLPPSVFSTTSHILVFSILSLFDSFSLSLFPPFYPSSFPSLSPFPLFDRFPFARSPLRPSFFPPQLISLSPFPSIILYVFPFPPFLFYPNSSSLLFLHSLSFLHSFF